MTEDLPVAVVLPSPLAQRVAAYIEHDLGWQVVDPDGSLLPALVLTDRPCGALPWIAVTDGAPADDRVTVQLTAGAEDVVGWPDDRDRIPLIAARVDLHRDLAPSGLRVSVSGVAGGVGTSTVALAIGGLLAWAGAAVLVVGGDALRTLAGTMPIGGVGQPPVADVDRASSAAFGAVDSGAPADVVGGAGQAALVGAGAVDGGAPAAGVGGVGQAPVAGVPRLSVAGRGADIASVAWSGDIVVSDNGTRVPEGTTVVVARADGALRRARALGAPVIVVGDRPLSLRDAERALGRPPIACLPWSVRVARAGLLGRVPSALPGRWLRTLHAGLRRIERLPS